MLNGIFFAHEILFVKSATFWGKWYFAAYGTFFDMNGNSFMHTASFASFMCINFISFFGEKRKF